VLLGRLYLRCITIYRECSDVKAATVSRLGGEVQAPPRDELR
jgi:hypothetical protein